VLLGFVVGFAEWLNAAGGIRRRHVVLVGGRSSHGVVSSVVRRW
jgi:hypothetical protein